jgi:hypothetical protein
MHPFPVPRQRFFATTVNGPGRLDGAGAPWQNTHAEDHVTGTQEDQADAVPQNG